MAAELAVFPELLFAHPSRAQWGDEGESQGAKEALFERMYKADPDLFTMDRADVKRFEGALNKVLNNTLKMDNLVTNDGVANCKLLAAWTGTNIGKLRPGKGQQKNILHLVRQQIGADLPRKCFMFLMANGQCMTDGALIGDR